MGTKMTLLSLTFRFTFFFSSSSSFFLVLVPILSLSLSPFFSRSLSLSLSHFYAILAVGISLAYTLKGDKWRLKLLQLADNMLPRRIFDEEETKVVGEVGGNVEYRGHLCVKE